MVGCLDLAEHSASVANRPSGRAQRAQRRNELRCGHGSTQQKDRHDDRSDQVYDAVVVVAGIIPAVAAGRRVRLA